MQMLPFKIKTFLLPSRLWFSQNSTCSQSSMLFSQKENFKSVKNCEGGQTVETSRFVHFTADECLRR